MIGALTGTLLERTASGSVIVDVGGVGYDVTVTPPTAARLGDVGATVKLRIYTRVREDAITLFGFATAEEKRCFEALIAAHGVGPAMALALLAMHTPNELRQIVAMDDAAALSHVPGIGKKTAARLLIELKQRFETELDSELLDISTAPVEPGNSARADVTAALAGLGYAGEEIRRVLATLPSEGTPEELVRLALRELATT